MSEAVASIEVIHLGRDGIGVEYEPRWPLAADGIALAAAGATGHVEVIRGDWCWQCRNLPAIRGRAGSAPPRPRPVAFGI